MPSETRRSLAIIGGFTRPAEHRPHGTWTSSFLICQALARSDHHCSLDIFLDDPEHRAEQGLLEIPKRPGVRIRSKWELARAKGTYSAIFAANGEQIDLVPWSLRPWNDWAPIICSVGSAHNPRQWRSLFMGLATGFIRQTDAFIFKSQAAQNIFRQTWDGWCDRLAVSPRFPRSTVIGNAVDVDANRRSATLREDTRRRLKITNQDVLFLSFSRLSWGTKGDQLALVCRWKEVVSRHPNAKLILAGAVVDKNFPTELRALTRAAGVADQVIVVENPFSIFSDARRRLMSAADVFVHLSTGLEEAAPMVVHEALAHGLPIVATRWAGLPALIQSGENGFLVDTHAVSLGPRSSASLFGAAEVSQGLRASRGVFCNWSQFLSHVAALQSLDVRSQMAEAARRSAEARGPDGIANEYLRFFESTGQDARTAWASGAGAETGPPPMVDLDGILSAQGALPLPESLHLRVGNLERVPWLCASVPGAVLPSDIGGILATFGSGQEVTLSEWTARITSLEDGFAPEDARLLLSRLLDFGVLTVVASPRSSPSH